MSVPSLIARLDAVRAHIANLRKEGIEPVEDNAKIQANSLIAHAKLTKVGSSAHVCLYVFNVSAVATAS